MRKLPLSLTVIGLLFTISCKKSSSSNNNNNNGGDSKGWVSSITSYSPGDRQAIVDSFSYDGTHRVASYQQFEYDTSSGTAYSANWSAIFTLPADTTKPPLTYTNDLSGTMELHELTYDAQNRIIRDSSTGPSGWVIYFGYSGNYIAINAWLNGNGNFEGSLIDTLFMSNGNIGSFRVYGPNDAGTADSIQGNLTLGYGNLVNPCYHSVITSSVGPLIYILAISGYGGNFDAVSQKAFNSISGQVDGLPGNVTLHYAQTADSQGRLIQETGNLGGSSGTITYRYYPQ